MEYVIIRKEDGKYVAKKFSVESYTKKLTEARIFRNREDAENEACGNERVVMLYSGN